MIVIGELRHRVVFQESVLTPDGSGGFTQEWRDLAEVAAAVVALSAAEQLRFQQLQTAVTHKIYIRWRADVTARMRAVKGGEVYDIVSATDRDGTGTCLEIMARRTV